MSARNILKAAAVGVSLPILLLAEVSPDAPLGLTLAREAAAIIGRPMTPMSYEGVARRTTARVVTTEAVVVTSAAAASAAQQQAIAQQQAAVAQQQTQTAALAVGTVVAALPAGCVAAPKGGIEYTRCGNGYYRAVFQGNNLVCVTVGR
jgi:hypothetical protein